MGRDPALSIERFARAVGRRMPGARRLRLLLSGAGRRSDTTVHTDVAAQLLGAFARAHPRATFVQVGSNDGTRPDPLRDVLMSSEWRGVMVEPVPYVFERLRSNYAGIDRIRTENVAIADHDGTQRLYYLPEASDDQLLPDWYDELASFKKDVVLQHSTEIPDIESRIESIDVPCLTFDSLCRKHSIAQLDVIHIDTEGYDWEIIRSVDLARLQPTLLIFEHYHLDPDLYGRCIEHLRSHAYEELAVGMNTVCVRPAGLSWRDRRFRDEWRSARAHPHLVFRADVDRRPRDGAQHSADR